MITEISLQGFLVGNIWMPAVECWKNLNYSITREDRRSSEPMTLREHVLRATNDGDFQSCSIAQGEIVITMRRQDGAKMRTVSRSFPLSRFPSVADCLHSDPDWWPTYPDED